MSEVETVLMSESPEITVYHEEEADALQSNPVTLGLMLSDFLLWEATPLTRKVIACPKGTRVGDFVQDTDDRQYYIALQNEERGKTVIQPRLCIIDLQRIPKASLDAQSLTRESLVEAGKAQGVMYHNHPKI